MRATVSEQNVSHLEVNETLGLPGAYTDAVQAFFDSVSLDLR